MMFRVSLLFALSVAAIASAHSYGAPPSSYGHPSRYGGSGRPSGPRGPPLYPNGYGRPPYGQPPPAQQPPYQPSGHYGQPLYPDGQMPGAYPLPQQPSYEPPVPPTDFTTYEPEYTTTGSTGSGSTTTPVSTTSGSTGSTTSGSTASTQTSSDSTTTGPTTASTTAQSTSAGSSTTSAAGAARPPPPPPPPPGDAGRPAPQNGTHPAPGNHTIPGGDGSGEHPGPHKSGEHSGGKSGEHGGKNQTAPLGGDDDADDDEDPSGGGKGNGTHLGCRNFNPLALTCAARDPKKTLSLAIGCGVTIAPGFPLQQPLGVCKSECAFKRKVFEYVYKGSQQPLPHLASVADTAVAVQCKDWSEFCACNDKECCKVTKGDQLQFLSVIPQCDGKGCHSHVYIIAPPAAQAELTCSPLKKDGNSTTFKRVELTASKFDQNDHARDLTSISCEGCGRIEGGKTCVGHN